MKKIINNKVYDTDTAKAVGTLDNGMDDMLLEYQTLYRKRTGEFFLYKFGGAKTQYARMDGDTWRSGEYITLIEPGKAKEWAKENLTEDEYNAVWEAPQTGKTPIFLNLSPASATKLREISAARGQTLSATVEQLIDNA
jgi:hypothetical protein